MTVDDSWSREVSRKFRLLERLVATRRALALLLAAVAAVVLLVGFVVRPDRLIVARLLSAACGCNVEFDAVGYGDGLSIADLRVSDDMRQLRLTLRGRRLPSTSPPFAARADRAASTQRSKTRRSN